MNDIMPGLCGRDACKVEYSITNIGFWQNEVGMKANSFIIEHDQEVGI
jgi:hypothetical protein